MDDWTRFQIAFNMLINLAVRLEQNDCLVEADKLDKIIARLVRAGGEGYQEALDEALQIVRETDGFMP